MKTVRFWKVETPFVTRYFDDETKANRFYDGCERASISTITRRNPARIAEIREMIDRDNATEARMAEEMTCLDARCEEWLREQR